MSNVLKFCGCRACREGLHRERGKNFAHQAVRRLRHRTKLALARGEEPPSKISVPYTW